MRSFSCLFALCTLVAVAYAAEFIDVQKPIEGKFIIVMNDKTSIVDRDGFLDTVREEMERDVANVSSVTDVFDINGLVGYFAALSPSMVQYHLNHPKIKYVEPDQIMSINYQRPSSPSDPSIVNAVVTQSGSTWGLARISRQAATTSGSYSYVYDATAGSGVEIYVVDTGVDGANADFGGRASTVYNAISGEPASDLNGHGTHCAGTAGGTKYGVAKKATIYGVKVLDADGSGTNSGVLLGIQYVTKNHGKKAVANMSLGGGFSQALNDAVTAAVNSGVAFAVAAGNENQNACNTSPASCPAAVTVGSITYTNARSSFSNYGKCLDIFAPGSDILSDWIDCPTTTCTNTISGTSMASPHVAGILAQQLSLNPSWTATQLVSNFIASATSGQVTSPGTSSPNLIAYSPY